MAEVLCAVPLMAGAQTVEPTRAGTPAHWGIAAEGKVGRVLVMDEYQAKWQRGRDMGSAVVAATRAYLPCDSDAFAADFGYPTLTLGARVDFYRGVTTHREADPAWGLLVPVDYDSRVGNMFTLYAAFNRPLLRTRRWQVDYQLGCGVGFTGTTYNKTDGIDNELIGSPVNIFFVAGVAATYAVTPAWGITLGVEYAHHSNGALARPNKGINTLGPVVGVQYMPYAEEVYATRRSFSPARFKPYWYADVQVGAGAKTLLEDWLVTQYATPPEAADYRTEDFTTYFAWSLSASAMYRYQRRWASGLGIDLFHGAYADRVAAIDASEGRDLPHSPWSVGLAARHEVFFGRFSAAMSLGAYLYRHMGWRAKYNEKRYYERIGVRYRPFGDKAEHQAGWRSVLAGMSLGFNVNAHATKADYTELVLSVPLVWRQR